MSDPVRIYTDGSCLGNPGPGGWAALLRYRKHEKELSGAEPNTTNNRMEITAAIHALEHLRRSCRVCLTTDSQYLQRGIRSWLPQWKRRAWKTSTGRRVKNLDLWQRLDTAVQRHEIEWRWVEGHSGHPENERVDVLARASAKALAGQRGRQL